MCNPGIAVLTESKRFPLVWDQLSTALPTWRRLLPTTVDPRDADWLRNDSWLVKSALCNTGDTVVIRSLLSNDQWRKRDASRSKTSGYVGGSKEICSVPDSNARRANLSMHRRIHSEWVPERDIRSVQPHSGD